MNLYVLSEDFYFILGLSHAINTNKYKLYAQHVSNGCLSYHPETGRNNIVVIDVVTPEYLHELIEKIPRGVRILFMSDMSFLPDSTYGFISKKVSVKTLLATLERCVNWNKIIKYPLTSRELAVISELAKGYPPHTISRRLNISVKTISTHKINALKKLGIMSKMNGLSMFYCNDIIYKLNILICSRYYWNSDYCHGA
ncbi:hypothetical protein GCM10023078_29350 [Gibbsiella greigii]